MKPISIPAPETLAAHERAALEIGELRRKGVPCHLEEHAGPAGHHLEIVQGPLEPAEDGGQARDPKPTAP